MSRTAAVVGLLVLCGCCSLWCTPRVARVPDAEQGQLQAEPQAQAETDAVPEPPPQAHQKIQVVGVENEWEPSPPPPPPYYPVSRFTFLSQGERMLMAACGGSGSEASSTSGSPGTYSSEVSDAAEWSYSYGDKIRMKCRGNARRGDGWGELIGCVFCSKSGKFVKREEIW